jgi:hypothetical protein
MDNQSPARVLAYGCIAAGIAMAFLSAAVPHYTAGYRLAAGILIAGLLPYLIYALAVPLLRGTLTAVVGVVLVILHAVLVFNERVGLGIESAGGLLYYGPMVLALAVLPLVVMALREPYDGSGKST